MSGRRLVIGLGNAYRGDDAFGLEVAGRQRGRVPDGVEIVTCERDTSRLIEAWDGAHAVHLVDAIESAATPGTSYRFDASDHPLPERLFRSSTHTFGVGEAIELARALGRLPGRVEVRAIEAAQLDAGAPLSAQVAAAAALVASTIRESLREA